MCIHIPTYIYTVYMYLSDIKVKGILIKQILVTGSKLKFLLDGFRIAFKA